MIHLWRPLKPTKQPWGKGTRVLDWANRTRGKSKQAYMPLTTAEQRVPVFPQFPPKLALYQIVLRRMGLTRESNNSKSSGSKPTMWSQSDNLAMPWQAALKCRVRQAQVEGHGL
jgi:hypothetical protein